MSAQSSVNAATLSPSSLPVVVRALGCVEYLATWQAMIDFTATRAPETPDEIWLCEHPPVYTLGQAGKPEHLLRETTIPLIKIDRGGQITYHGPGQVVIYLLIDLNRRELKIKNFVSRIEQAIINLLAELGVAARRLEGAPGVYVDGANGVAKIAALGLRIRRGCSYHGLSVNVDMDLSPFSSINPCGYEGLAVTQTRDLGIATGPKQLSEQLAVHLVQQLEKT